MDQYLRDVATHLSEPLCILAGAGISYPSPASLPTALNVLRRVLSTLPVPEQDRATLLDALSPEWKGGLGYFDFLRFEQVTEALQYCGDHHIALLQSVVRHTSPNRYHYQLGRLLDAGHVILTTNYDCLIERACDDLHIAYTVLVSNRDYEQFLTGAEGIVNPIFKLHGTSYPHGVDADLVAATFQTVTTERSSMVSKWRAVDEELAKHDLLVIGYSGSDDFDVMPSIRIAPRKLLWIQHGDNDTPVRWFLSENQAPSDLGIDRKLHWFFGRMFGSLRYEGSVKRQPGDVLVARLPTGQILDELLEESPRPQELPGPLVSRLVGAPLQIEPLFPVENSVQCLLFVGTLFRCIGMFDRALEYLERAAVEAESAQDLRIAPRVQTAIARIWIEREQWDVASESAVKMLMLRKNIAQLEWIDALDVTEISCRLGLSKATDGEFLSLIRAQDWLTEQQLDRLRRATRLWESERLLNEGALVEALQGVRACLNDMTRLDLEEKADALWLTLQIRRAKKWQEVAKGRREDAAWDESESAVSHFMLEEARETFESFQRKPKWAGTMLFEAEEHMWKVSPDWSKEATQVAAAIYSKIGHQTGYAQCMALEAHLSAINAGETGAIHYRSRPSSRPPNTDHDVRFFCPRCLAFTSYRFRHCCQCGWFAATAPQSTADADMDPVERARRLHELFSRVGRSLLGGPSGGPT